MKLSKGIVDILVLQEMEENVVTFVTDRDGGLPQDLQEIQEEVTLTLKKGPHDAKVSIRKEYGDESPFQFAEINPKLAKKLSIRNGTRYALEYDPKSNTLELIRMPATQVSATVTVGRSRSKSNLSLTVGYALLSLLGAAENRPAEILLKKGTRSQKIRLFVPENELNGEFRVTPLLANQYGLEDGKPFLMEYNQVTKVLSILGPATTDISMLLRKRKRLRKRLTAAALRQVVISVRQRARSPRIASARKRLNRVRSSSRNQNLPIF
ncbi:hypothetical protein RAC89_19045 [Paenibacillus sp. GD4]|uniref:hypothetical protein n=1 Tax=Paenibacillus sp. GD4 TaxID=3068890 RepID=UPI002796ACA1|nr:hypothetical protein [Paenibacillus sp. GD4]MDQ1912493.1 hypothetical protein [Paenibacillus sp. GD4]